MHTGQEKWAKKKLAASLFMDVKGAFDYVSKRQLIKRMIELGVDGNLVRWTKLFLTDQTGCENCNIVTRDQLTGPRSSRPDAE